jgi:hypothetical protein
MKGKYAYIESSQRRKGEKAQLTSKVMTGTQCMQFMYNMRGVYMGSIDVVQAYKQERKVLLSLSGNHDRPWHKARVNIPDVKQAYKVKMYRYFLQHLICITFHSISLMSIFAIDNY